MPALILSMNGFVRREKNRWTCYHSLSGICKLGMRIAVVYHPPKVDPMIREQTQRRNVHQRLRQILPRQRWLESRLEFPPKAADKKHEHVWGNDNTSPVSSCYPCNVRCYRSLITGVLSGVNEESWEYTKSTCRIECSAELVMEFSPTSRTEYDP